MGGITARHHDAIDFKQAGGVRDAYRVELAGLYLGDPRTEGVGDIDRLLSQSAHQRGFSAFFPR